MRVFAVRLPIATYLGALALVLAVSFSPPVSCSHGVIGSWQAPMHLVEDQNRLHADYPALSQQLDLRGGERGESGDNQRHRPWQDSRTTPACSGLASASWSVPFVLSPLVGYPTSERPPNVLAHSPPLEPPPRPTLAV